MNSPGPETHPEQALFVGIDVGTSGCRAAVIDANENLLAQEAVALTKPQGAGAMREQDPTLWWRAVQQLLWGLKRHVATQHISAIAIDGTSATTLLVHEDGRPMGPALMYNDTRARGEADQIAHTAPEDSSARSASSSLAKALFLMRRWNLPPGARVLHQADWIAGMLCGRFDATDENNALKLGYDLLAGGWPSWLEALGVPVQALPDVYPPGTTLGAVRRPLAEKLGLSNQARVVAGTTDSTAAFLATGANQPGDAVTSLGSTLVLKVVSPQPIAVPQLGVYSHRLGDLWLTGGASNSGGAVLLKYFSRAQLSQMTPLLRPNKPTGLDYYPLPERGERFPVNDPDRPPRLLPRPTDPICFFQGMLEGIARIEARGYRLLEELGAPYPRRVYTVGGGAVNPAWTRIRERLLGIPVKRATHDEAAFGAAKLALRGTLGLGIP